MEQNGRSFAALKILKPAGLEEEGRGLKLLQWYAGDGAVTVFDVHGDSIFMEWLDGSTLGEPSRAGKDDEATIALASVVSNLHRPRADMPTDLVPLRERFEPLFNTEMRVWPHTARDLFARASGIARKLFDKPAAEMALHGDLHHDNIISSDRGWLAIDPKGVLGDPHYEVANAFRNPQGAAIASDPRRIKARADILSSRLGFDRKRMLGFAAAHSGLSICWNLASGDSITNDLAVLPLLLNAYDQA